jgi:hypothetical protein
MKKIYLLAIFLLILIATFIANLYFLNNKATAPGVLVSQENNCAKEGEYAGGSAVDAVKNCCSGLTAMIKFEYNGGCSDLIAPGLGYICSSTCGNGKCELWENKCNCPEDCKQPQNTLLTPKDDKELRACVNNNECSFVETKKCCDCYEIINKKYLNYWNNLSRQDCNALDIACEACEHTEADLSAVCLNGICQAKIK